MLCYFVCNLNDLVWELDGGGGLTGISPRASKWLEAALFLYDPLNQMYLFAHFIPNITTFQNYSKFNLEASVLKVQKFVQKIPFEESKRY